ncbi:hypothetical protein GQ607_013806 [Colletotrichum asianum]|uniref:Uncharacterized protein n=1 Tax=Colletotrichum asianum TaxID=702518 RepID=A0A8H3ZKG1_9PEZI|nr:hypothetical protein GQ607_013806 [Colletotrichum asianum]
MACNPPEEMRWMLTAELVIPSSAWPGTMAIPRFWLLTPRTGNTNCFNHEMPSEPQLRMLPAKLWPCLAVAIMIKTDGVMDGPKQMLEGGRDGWDGEQSRHSLLGWGVVESWSWSWAHLRWRGGSVTNDDSSAFFFFFFPSPILPRWSGGQPRQPLTSSSLPKFTKDGLLREGVVLSHITGCTVF